MNARHTDAGFTSIELMIVVVIFAVSAAVVYPSYQESVARGRRAEAKAVLLESAQWLERQYTITNAYDKRYDTSGMLVATTSAALPHTEAPKGGASKYYDIGFGPTLDATRFTLQAAPKNAMANDRCGTFTLSHTGLRGVSGADVVTCWDR